MKPRQMLYRKFDKKVESRLAELRIASYVPRELRDYVEVFRDAGRYSNELHYQAVANKWVMLNRRLTPRWRCPYIRRINILHDSIDRQMIDTTGIPSPKEIFELETQRDHLVTELLNYRIPAPRILYILSMDSDHLSMLQDQTPLEQMTPMSRMVQVWNEVEWIQARLNAVVTLAVSN